MRNPGLDAAARGMQEELLQWRVRVTCEATPVDVLCCPEDTRCQVCACDGHDLCEHCEVPLRTYCFSPIAEHGRKPQQALSNDLMIYYAPRELYELNVTFMEMICASPCLTTMACFSLEKRYRAERVMDELAQSNVRRIAARGNATTFPLPWEHVLTQLQNLEEARAHTAAPPLLPRTGQELSDFVTVLLKTCDGQVTEESPCSRCDSASRGICSAHRERMRSQPQLGLPPRVDGRHAREGGSAAGKRCSRRGACVAAVRRGSGLPPAAQERHAVCARRKFGQG